MKLSEFKSILRREPNMTFCIKLPDGEAIPADFHVTEVGHVVKNFIDCGGTTRSVSSVVLQTWVARNDKDHRLNSGKLIKLLDMAKSVVPSDDLDLEVEYEGNVISQYPVSTVSIEKDQLKVTLVEKHTDCLAREACGLEPAGCGCGPSDGAKCC